MVKQLFIVGLFFGFCRIGFSQNNETYIQKNSLYLNKPNDSEREKKFLGQDYYFLGEEHYASNIDSIRASFINFVITKKKINYIFLEEGVNGYEDLEAFSKSPTTGKCCYNFVWDLGYYQKVLNAINTHNLKNEKVTVLPIDVFHAMDQYRKYDALRFLQFRETNHPVVRRHMKILKKAEGSKRDLKFKQFADSFEVHKDLYKAYLGKDYYKLEKIVDAFVVNYNTVRLQPDSVLNAPRERFMFNNILSEIDSSDCFISLNGTAHITMEPEGGNVIKFATWKSLARRVYEYFPKKKTCSVFIMSREAGDLDLYFKEEKALIFNSIKPGEIILLDLRAENSPFKNLSQIFSYVLIY